MIHGWNLNTSNIIKNLPINQGQNGTFASGYQSFYHPLNQYKGIGISFIENPNNHSQAFPIIVFTNDKNPDLNHTLGLPYLDMITVIEKLGL